ncbi:MAG: sigma-70 family RNA polymerase sigma factor [Longimicrobiales bacterium]
MTEPRNATPHEPSSDTELLLACRSGERGALDRLFSQIYDELRRVAHVQLRRESEGHTLGTTALVHEAYIRMIDITRVEWRDRVHFLSMAARAMRRVLIDHARQHQAIRRGGGVRPVTLDESLIASGIETETLVALDDALEQLGALNPRLVRVVECRFFGGMTEEETAQALEVTSRTVRNDWVKARGWLRKAIGSPRQ